MARYDCGCVRTNGPNDRPYKCAQHQREEIDGIKQGFEQLLREIRSKIVEFQDQERGCTDAVELAEIRGEIQALQQEGEETKENKETRRDQMESYYEFYYGADGFDDQ